MVPNVITAKNPKQIVRETVIRLQVFQRKINYLTAASTIA
ncbi:hypothetical protein B6N60_00408 [Richelia sinica FACHB-800]|uniref:Uncharacterized protein n=1 Tax=Richelia sinica FACHB-800 TaxID=1357546 RepID=A0A975T5E2_9NOST|nr:hypothetical protein B6N60_00408 [Richelia sinica FACHB-800]